MPWRGNTTTYNAEGIRTSKTINGIRREYLLDGSQIVSETWTENGLDHILVYLYDEKGAPLGLKYRNNAYATNDFNAFFFEKNLQGDIIAVYNIRSCTENDIWIKGVKNGY